VYLIYQGVRLIYVGMAKKNLLGRLTQHARGNRSGDQFCVYLGDCLVMPKLGIDQMKDLFSGELSLDHEIKKFVRSQLSYLLVQDDPTAHAKIDLLGLKLKLILAHLGSRIYFRKYVW
jgi:hypothetical protein